MRTKAFSSILKKNFKLLLRSRSSAIIIILGPLLVVLLIGFAFSNSQSQLSVSVGVYSEKYSELAGSIVQKMAGKFSVYQFDSLAGCVKYVRRGRVNLCMAFPPDLDVKSEESEITFYVDYSRINAVWMILDVISEKISDESAQISTKLTDVLLNKLLLAQDESEDDMAVVSVMIDRQDILSTKISALYSGLGGLDLEPSDFKAEEFEKTAGYLGELCEKAANISLGITAGVYDAMYDANCTDTDPIEDVIEPAEEELKQLADAITATLSENGTFDEQFSNVMSAASQTQNQLKQASELRDSAVYDRSVEKMMKNQTASLLLLNSSLDRMAGEIAALEIKDSAKIVSPITTRIEPVTLEVKYFNYLFPTLIVLIVMITSILLSSTIVMNEKKSASFFRNAIAPISAFWFNLGTFVTSFLIILLQLAVFITVALAFTNIQFLSGIPTAALSLLFIISSFVLFGMLVGYWFRSEETTTLAAISFSCLFLFFSGTILPVESMPPVVQFIAQYNPFVVAENLLRQSLIFHSGILAFANGIIILAAWTAVFFLITLALIKTSAKSGFYKQKKRF